MLAIDENHIEGFVKGCLERIAEDDADEKNSSLETIGRTRPSGRQYKEPKSRLRGQDRDACGTVIRH